MFGHMDNDHLIVDTTEFSYELTSGIGMLGYEFHDGRGLSRPGKCLWQHFLQIHCIRLSIHVLLAIVDIETRFIMNFQSEPQ